MLIVVLLALTLAALPALLFLANLRQYRRLPDSSPPEAADARAPADLAAPLIAVLIPARNEEAVIAEAVRSALAQQDWPMEVLILDDHSTDRTAAIVQEIARSDARVRWIEGSPLPPGWCGKQFACHQLAQAARAPWLVFIDADVRLQKDALPRMLRFMQLQHADLGSGLPRQITLGWLEKLVIPIIHFLLLGFLPLRRMRQFPYVAAYAAGCGQLFITHRSAYEKAGGHAAIQASLHDGIQLPRSYRRRGCSTDLFDATDAAECRMYSSAGSLFMGFAKNATEGMASSLPMLCFWTTLLLGGQVLPWALLFTWPWLGGVERALTLAAILITLVPRLLGCLRFRQSWLGALLHPVGVLIVIIIQWFGYLGPKLGLSPRWKGRAYPPQAKPSSA